MPASRSLTAVAACLAPAAASLLIADEPVYDAWAWLVWGRELAALDLDTTSGPAFKPLPVALTTALSLAGDAAPQLWLVLVRFAWLLSLLLAAELAVHLAAGRPRVLRIAAGAFAAASLVLLRDDVTPWGRQVAGGMSEPLLVALLLGAIRAGLARRPVLALALAALAALVRPETFPLLALYAVWCWRTEPRVRPAAGAAVLAAPALWLAPELLQDGGGSAARAQTETSDPRETVGWALALPLAIAWPLALAALADARARVLGAGALAWIAIVGAMTLAGFAGLPRFMAPAAAIIGVLGGAGLAALLARPRPRGMLIALLAATLVLTAIALPGRVGDVSHGWRSAARIGDSHDRLRVVVGGLGRKRLLACGRLATSDVLVRTALAWKLDVALGEVLSFGVAPRRSGAFVVGLRASAALRRDVRRSATLVAREGEWSVYSLDCPATARASPPPARSAGVSGAMR